MTASLPAWAEEMRDLFKSGSVAQFILHGNVFDVVPADNGSKSRFELSDRSRSAPPNGKTTVPLAGSSSRSSVGCAPVLVHALASASRLE